MSEAPKITAETDFSPDPRIMQLRYGFNEFDGWWDYSIGDHSEEIRRRLQLMNTQVIRIFVFEQLVPDPIKNWQMFVAYVQGALDVGAKPMLTFAKYPPPHDSAQNRRVFIARCREIVWGCIEHWGGDVVKDWYWCVWNEPNNPIVGGGLSFPIYRLIYEELAQAVFELLQPFLAGKKARIGGPAADGTHRSYWLDWVVRLVNEVDDRLVGFVSWHRYGDWRPAVPSASLNLEMWGAPDPPTGEVFETLLMAQTPIYEAHARSVARVLRERDILNVCGELNTIAHYENYYTLGLNQNLFGAAYYISALIHLLRGGADLEMRWTATSHDDAYGLVSMYGEPSAAALAKQIFTQHVRYGDFISFPPHKPELPEVDAIIAWSNEGRRSGVLVNTSNRRLVLRVEKFDEQLMASTDVLQLDKSTAGGVAREAFGHTLTLNGYGIAIITNDANTTIID
jgi:hypothetical protein